MAHLQLTHAPILNSSAQLLILPVNNAGILLDPILARTKNLYPDNYQRYYRACRDGSLVVGSCLLHKRSREQAGLGVSSNGNQPNYIANLVISDHPYHPTRARWLTTALLDLQQQLIPLIRYQGIRRIALLARPLISSQGQNIPLKNSDNDSSDDEIAKSIALDWYIDILPLLNAHLQDCPKLRIDIHLPKDINI
ncbi:hypothetical protein [Psychrobacter sp. ANT_WB68]|uniref:hypothetical protein n=1 Tax=Psychrobacter sp. ANT_WB68 TaxID=2597355 RepID=UPI0011F25BFA|nr:hypothetical protein [Psychrobacter sp. ANT_WB68]KAA0913473.1 hypothetical protein FQ084_09220 [Psychrobacter sp. ANT_WB68]